MAAPAQVFVTGITGNQGGAIARSLLKNDIQVVGLSRNPNSEIGLEFSKLGVKMVEGSLDDRSSYEHWLSEVESVYAVTPFGIGIGREIDQGVDLINASKEQGVTHLVFASVVGSDKGSGIPHFESKHKIERHLIVSGIPHTIIRLGSFCENLLNPEVLKRLRKGKLVLPQKPNIGMDMISMHDLGIAGAKILTFPETYNGRIIPLASDFITMNELTTMITQAAGRPFEYKQLSPLITRLVMGKDLAKMFKWFNEDQGTLMDQKINVQKEFEGLSGVQDFVNNTLIPALS